MIPEVRARIRQAGDGLWVGRGDDPSVEVSADTSEACVRALEAAVSDTLSSQKVPSFSLLIEVIPKLVGVAEAAEIVGWDKRHVITYLNRGSFPEPLESLASGRIWALDDVLEFRNSLEARRAARKAKADHPRG